jgi:hypothetical protein
MMTPKDTHVSSRRRRCSPIVLCHRNSMRTCLYSSLLGSDDDHVSYDDAYRDAATKFTIRTCSAASCTSKRRSLGLDPIATFSAFYVRSVSYSNTNDDNNNIQVDGSMADPCIHLSVDESSCLGSCKYAPCVSIEHDEFDGPVALEGMTEREFQARTFQMIVTEDDVDRVWSCVQNAITVMMMENEEEEEYEEN